MAVVTGRCAYMQDQGREPRAHVACPRWKHVDDVP